MALNIETTNDDKFPKTVKAIIFGRPGAGKTAMIRQYPNPFMLAAETRLMSIAGAGIPFARCNDDATFAEILRTVKLPAAEREEAFGFPVDTLVIDTLDELQGSIMAEKFSGGADPGYKGWEWIREYMHKRIKTLCDLPDLNVIINCHIKTTTTQDDEGDEVVSHQPAIVGSFRDALPGLVDLAFMIEPNTKTVAGETGMEQVTEKEFICQPTAKYPFLKDGSPGTLPARIPMNFKDDFKRIFDLVYEAKAAVEEQKAEKRSETNSAVAQYATVSNDTNSDNNVTNNDGDK